MVRGVASVALRSLAIAAECLNDRREQEEVLQIFEKISKETGWRIGFLHKELKEKWGWADEEALRQQQQMGSSSVLQPHVKRQPHPGDVRHDVEDLCRIDDFTGGRGAVNDDPAL